ncbi:High-affinity branched-chain amino acid transport system permease protein LivH [Xylophilus ampelinus]|uniref:Branched-chain amino acid ABC transporter permease n=1 Tax=Variovorax paradoxus TaxID=34073 RepID=A0A2W5PWJ7_VARPD|nr:branched-chain amino acid ABC transporter permease [Variovorax sp.]MBO9643614.1 branched-chain amino acid ABC transporter permease [Pseudacidovorax sp.]PZQ69836.1 MAG: branched-chain amino acid ABC transporter permease [Variovorax paradoxus]VTY35905.1 High-affinity branched-chain amino acid transport system permease protein LivH [Xylophilus ampelinus]
MNAQAIAQVLASGVLMGLMYALIAVGLSLIFGLMDVVNFAHGEFLMMGMYLTFGLAVGLHLDPLIGMPIVGAVLFMAGVLVYLLIVRHAMRAKANVGMVQIFSTFGLGTLMQGLAQYFFTPDYRQISDSWLANKTVEIGGVFLPQPQIAGAVVSLLAFGGLYLLMSRTDFGRALEATREDQGAVALVGIDRNRVFALGWGLGLAMVGVAGAMLANFYYIHPQVGGAFSGIAYVVVALGGFGSVFGALVGGVVVGLVEAMTTLVLPASLKTVGVYALYLLVVLLRPSGLFGRL